MTQLDLVNLKVNKPRQEEERTSSSFPSPQARRRYFILLGFLLALGVLASYGLLNYNNPVDPSSPSYPALVRRRVVALVAMLLASFAQSLATLAFQSITNNPLITPSLLGFEAVYTSLQTASIFFLGSSGFLAFNGRGPFLIQVGLMVLFCLILYGWLFAGKYGNMELMLLVGVIMGTGLRSMSSFMRKLLAPAEFDILQARLFASVNNADPAYFPLALVLLGGAGILLLLYSEKLNVLALGRDVATSLGLNHKLSSLYVLFLVALLMSVSTALVGPLSFFGFLVVSLSYQLVPSYDHRYLFPMALVLGFLILTGSYFLMYHVFDAQGVVSVIIEMFGGLVFLFIVLRKGNL